MSAKKQKTLRARLISVFLAMMVLIGCIPSFIFSAAAASGSSNPIVLTNASVEFRDSKFRSIDQADAGALFYLMVTIAGNNVNQEEGKSDQYRIEITDSNLLLPNFAGNGFVNGAEYNGYTLHVNGDGTRYIEFNIENGSTAAIRLQAKFANGKTPNGDQATAKLVQEDSGKSVSNTITAKAKMAWNASKSQSRTSLAAKEITDGTTVNYTLSASANNPTSSKGAEWVETLRFEDTITLTGMDFTSGADTAIQAAVESAITSAGWTAADGVNVSVNGKTASVSFDINSKNTSAEMGAVNLNVALPLNSDTVTVGADGGTIKNELSVSGKPYGSDTFTSIGGNSVSLNVSAPPEPVGPKFSLSKSADTYTVYTNDTNPTVKFTVSVANYGDQPGDITLVDTLPEGMTTADNTTITFENVAPGETKDATISVNVDTSKVTLNNHKASLTNEVVEEGNPSNKATCSITVEEKTPDISISKTGYVGTDKTNTWYDGGDTAHYEISVTNHGEVPAAAGSVVIKDTTLIAGMTAMTGGNDITSALTGSDGYTYPNEIAPDETVTIEVEGTIPDDPADSITNQATVTYDGNTKYSENVEFKKNAPEIVVEKKVDKETYKKGDTLTYTITVSNIGTKPSDDVILEEKAISGFKFVSWERKSDRDPNKAYSSGELTEFWNSLSSHCGLDVGETITLTFICEVTDDVDSITNTAYYWYYEDKEHDKDNPLTSNAVTSTIDRTGDYKVEKWVADEGGSKAEYVQGEFITYRLRFTNVSDENGVQDLYIFDHAQELCFTKDGAYGGEIISLEVVSEGNDAYPKGTIISNVGSQAAGMAGFYCNLPGVNLSIGESIELEYKACFYGNSTGGSRNSETGYMIKPNELKPELTQQGIYNYVKCSKDNGSTFIAEDLTWNAVRNTFSTKKQVSPAEPDISNMTLNDLLDETYQYVITFQPNTQDATSYSGKTFTITDELPDGMTYVEGSAKGSYGSNWSPQPLTIDSAVQEGNILTLTFQCPTSLNQNDTNPVSVLYNTKLTEEKAQELYETEKKSTELTNTVTKVTVGTGDDAKEKTPNATATVNFKKVTPAPGFAKLAVASFASTVYPADDVEESVSKVENGYITAGDSLIWQAVLYNGKGQKDSKNKPVLNGEEIGNLDLTNVKITDTLPGCYEFNNKTGLEMRYQILDLTYDESTKEAKFAVDNKGMIGGSPVPEDAITSSGSMLTIDASKLGIENNKLKPNQCIVVQFVTTIKSGQEKEGVITNTGYATIDQSFSVQDVVAGEKQDTTIWNYANYNIVGLTTESWKTITYENQGHNGTPHKDPITDTGESRNPTHNYVQGMQGEKVTYELHVQNNSPLSLENMTIIDRLPYVDDIGLVSGYARHSAFGVTMGNITSVTVDGEKVSYTAAYSTDKTSILTEFSKDWRGQNDVMSWTADPTNAVNFRLILDPSKKIAPASEVVVTFTATVPSYVANTGEENIAWNSFAYAYQNTGVLGDTVMIAEPAKVGVWVETPDTKIDVKINKTSDSAGTFYFALFGDADGTNRLSDIVSLTLTGTAATGSVTMEDIDLASMKQQMEEAGITNADNIYLLETDANGNALKNTASPYTVTYDTENTNVIPTDTEANSVVEVDVTNTKNTGSITVNKTLAGDKITGDTFYFALFTKSDENYIRYEDVPVQSLTFTEAGEQSLTFENVPKGVDFYVLETNANGVIADTDFENYTSDSGINYTSTSPAAVQAGDTCSITNTEKTNYSITVSKVLISDSITTNPTFTVGLFDNADGTGTPIQTEEVTSGSEVTFDGLESGKEYYVFELNADGNAVQSGDSFKQSVQYLNNKGELQTADDLILYPSYNGCAAITLNDTAPQANAVVTNSTENPSKITVTKKAVTIDAAGTASIVKAHKITVGLYVLDNEGNYVQAKDADDNLVEKQTVATGEDGTFTIEFSNLRSGVTYYVFELDTNDTLVFEGSTTVVDGQTFVATYSGSNSQVVLEDNVPGVKNITDTSSKTVRLSFAKLDVTGAYFAGASMTIKDDNDKTVEEWISGDSSAHVLENGLDPGKYTLTETAEGFDSITVDFTVGGDGYLTSGNTDANVVVTANSVTVINRATVNVSKQDIANKGIADKNEELPGATIAITTKGSINTDLLMLTQGDKDINYTVSTDKETGLTTLTFTSGEEKTVIVGLPDGDYTMTETIAPDDYTKLTTDLDFSISGGRVSSSSYDEDAYVVDDTTNTVTMFDSAKKTITIHKTDLGGTEISGAEMTLAYSGDETLTNVKATGGMEGSFAIDTEKNIITWISNSDAPLQLTDFPDGDYTLHEEAAPDGYTCITDFNFTITDGKITSTVGDRKDVTINDDGNVLTATDNASAISIDKMEITGETEVAGATLKLTGDVNWTTVMEENTGLTEVMDTEDTTKQIGVQWESTNAAKVITYLPDGTYTLEEYDANGNGQFEYNGKTYSVLTSTMTFEIENGVIKTTDGAQTTTKNADANEGYYYYNSTEDANAIKVCDAVAADKTVSVNISKQDIEGTEVSGATLRVYYTETVAVTDENGKEITDADGNVQTTVTEINVDEWESDGETTKTIEGLAPDKEYILEEIGAPNGYAYAESIAFSVDKDGKVTVDKNGKVGDDGKTVIMTDKALALSIDKKDITKTGEVEGAKLQLLDKDGILIEEWTSGAEAHKIDQTKLKAGETYTLHEEGAPDGYAYAEDITFMIQKDGSIELVGNNGEIDGATVIMKDDVTKVTISKKDATTGEEIEGAELKLYQITDKDGIKLTEKKLVDSWTSGSDGVDEEGKLLPHEINGTLIAGATYELVEITEPDGYQKAEPVEFTVNKDGTVNKVEMFDTREGEVSISKVDINSSEEIAGAALQILKGEEIVESWTSGEDKDADGNLLPHTVKLDAGTYTLKEITAPDGYVKAEEITFTVDENGNVTLADGTETGTIVMKDDYTKVKLSKQSITGDTELPGAKLQVRDSTGKVIDEWTSSTEAHEIDKLVPGEYTLHEEGAPDGYAYASDVPFTVEETGEVQIVTMKDEALTVTLSKKALTGDDELPGAELSLYLVESDENGKETGRTLVDKWTSGTKAHVITIDSETTSGAKLIAGATYVMVETGAPDGYQYATDMYFTINQDGSTTSSTVMRDAAIGELGISKKDINGEEVIGAHLQILNENGEIEEEWDSIKEPHIVMLDAGTYTLVETIAPDGYQVASSIQFTVDAAGNATVNGVDQKGLITMTDDIAKVSISKVGKDGSAAAELAGADMRLTYTGDGTLDNVTALNGTITKGGKTIAWTSGDTAITLEKIPNGSYVLEETLAPDGYDVATKITFEVTDGKVTNVQIAEDSKSTYEDGVIRMFDAVTTVTSATTTSSTTETTTEITTETSETATSAGPTQTTTETTTETSETATSAGSTQTTTETTTETSETATSAGSTQTTAETTTETSGTATSAGSTQTTAETTTETSGTATSAGPTQTTTETTTATSGTVTSAGPTQTTTGETTTTLKTTTTTKETTTTEKTTTTEEITTTEKITTTEEITTTKETTATEETTTTEEITTTKETTATEETTTTEEVTTTVEETTTEEITTEETTTTTIIEVGIVIRKCDIVGNEIAGASLTVEDLDGNLIDAWISEEGISHPIENVAIGVPYRLTETLAPADFAIAAPIYFQLEEDGTVSILTYQLDEEGNLVYDETGAPILLTVTAGTDRFVVMVDEYTGTGILTGSTTPEVTTITTTTTTEQSEDTTTTPHNTTEDNGTQTPAVSTDVSEETTTATEETTGDSSTTAVNGTTSKTTAKTNGGGTTARTTTRSRTASVSSSPKTRDIFGIVLIPTCFAAITIAAATGRKRRTKNHDDESK